MQKKDNKIIKKSTSVKWIEKTEDIQGNTLKYPEITEGTDYKNEINKEVLKFINDIKNSNVTPSDSSTKFSNIFNVTYNKKGYFSIKFTSTIYTQGAAHPNTQLDGITFNIETGKIVEFKEYFLPEFNPITRSNDYIAKYIKDNDVPVFAEFTGIKNSKNYYLTDKGFTFFFQPYELTPYAFGPLEVNIPYSEYSNLAVSL